MSTLPSKIQTLTAAENAGIILGMAAGWIASVLVCGLIIHWILGALALGAPPGTVPSAPAPSPCPKQVVEKGALRLTCHRRHRLRPNR